MERTTQLPGFVADLPEAGLAHGRVTNGLRPPRLTGNSRTIFMGKKDPTAIGGLPVLFAPKGFCEMFLVGVPGYF